MSKKKPEQNDRFFTGIRLWLILLLPAALLYSVTREFSFSTLDDQWLVPNNEPFLQSEFVLFRLFVHPVLDIYYRPVFMISLLADYWLWGTDAAGFHITNVMLHLITTVLVFYFLSVNQVDRRMAVALAVLFSLHPLHLQAVAWIPGRNDILLAIFSLSALILLVEAIRKESRRLFVAHLIFVMLALLTKETAVVLPIVCCVILSTGHKMSLRTRALVMTSWLVLLLVYGIARLAVVDAGLPSSQPLVQHVRDFALAVNLYMGKFVIVTRQSVMPSIHHSTLWPGILTVIIIGTIVAVFGLRYRQRALVGISMVLFYLLLPVWFASGISSDAQYEHRAYVPLAGFALFVASLNLRSSLKLVFATVVVAGVYMWQSWHRIGIYRNEEIFVKTGLNENPDNHLFCHQRAVQLLAREQYQDALVVLDRSIQLRPSWPQSLSLRAHCYYSLGMMRECIADYSRLDSMLQRNVASDVASRKHYADEKLLNSTIYGNRMLAYWNLGDLRNALADLHRISKAPGSVRLPAPVLGIAKKLVDTLNHIKMMADKPGSPAALNVELAGMYQVMENTSAAQHYIDRARSADPAEALPE